MIVTVTETETAGATMITTANGDAIEIAKTTAGGTNTTTIATGGETNAETETERTTTKVSVGEKNAETATGGTVVEVLETTSGAIGTGVGVETRRIGGIDGIGAEVEMTKRDGEGGKRGTTMMIEMTVGGETERRRGRRGSVSRLRRRTK
jgi:hypothetical protein